LRRILLAKKGCGKVQAPPSVQIEGFPVISPHERILIMLKTTVLVLILVPIVILVPLLLSRRPRAIPAVGGRAPEFALFSQHGELNALRNYRGRWVVLYFYPRDQTPGCTLEAHNFQLDQAQYGARRAVVLGVSVDSVASHKKFCEKEGLNFKLLADSSGAVSRAYGSLNNFGVVKFSARHTFLIDPEGKIAKAYTKVDPERHSEQVLSDLNALQSTAGTGSGN
jgi:thioredoxin-dependent peroxiredoxin